MSKNKPINQSIKEHDYILTRLKFVQTHFPDAQVQEYYVPAFFKSKMVALHYTDIEVINSTIDVTVMPYHKLLFKYDNQEEEIKIHSIPTKSKLAYIDQQHTSNGFALEKIIKFSKLSFNLKSSKFNDEMVNDCRIHILQFIRDHSDCKLDDSNLEDRLKKLLIFT